jgi:mannosyltransferase
VRAELKANYLTDEDPRHEAGWLFGLAAVSKRWNFYPSFVPPSAGKGSQLEVPVATRLDLSKTHKVILVFLVMVLSLAIRMYRLGHESFWVDEVHQFRVASQPLMDIIENYRQNTAHETHDQAPLSMLVTHFFVVEEDAEYFARIPTVIFGVLGVLSLFFFARKLVPFSTALFAAIFLAISPLAVWYSQDARWYSQWSLGTTLSYIALLRATERPRAAGAWMAFWFATLANLYTFVYSVFIMAAQGLSLVWRKIIGYGKWSSIITFTIVNLVVTAASIPVILMIIQRAETDQFYSGTARASSLFEIPYTFLAFVTGFTVGPSLSQLHGNSGAAVLLRQNPVLFVVGAVFIPIFLVGLRKVLQDSRLATWIIPWMALPPLSVFLFSLIVPDLTYQVRYTIAALPPFVLVLAIGVSSLRPLARRVAVASVLVVCTYSLANFFWADKYDKEDARGATDYLRSVDDGPIQVVAVGQIEYAMYYYGDHPEIRVIRGCGTGETMDGVVDRSDTIWLISGRDWEHDKDRCLADLESTHRVSDHRTFTGIELWRLEPREEIQ